uniref:Single-stranded DNA binding protein n=1 Tax=Balbiania investiens TaxID=111861 RepID=A0A4D6BL44_9FLOR|nr:hypothetical protein [Balbiania investiens]QBX88674.1 hypothetical protein [Balbiania investiens]
MNTCFLTAQIATTPKQYLSYKEQKFIKFTLKIPNPKKGRAFYYMNAIAKGECSKNLLNWYRRGDYIIIEGHLSHMLIKYKAAENIKIIQIHIIKEFPTGLDL